MVPEHVKSKVAQYYSKYSDTAKDLFHFWKSEIVFTFSWWIGLLFIAVPWLIWFFVRDKRNTHKYLYAGFFVIIVSSYLDFIGIQAGLWMYYIEVVPTIPAYFIWDFTLMPVLVILMIQYKPTVNPYIKAVIFSIISSFIAEPLFESIGFYHTIHWKYYYSVPIQFVIFLAAFKLSSKIPAK
jgi:hypothetical protein